MTRFVQRGNALVKINDKSNEETLITKFKNKEIGKGFAKALDIAVRMPFKQK